MDYTANEYVNRGTKVRETIITLLRSVDRKGMGNVIKYLDESGFFTAPSSMNRHHNWYGGLAQHSLGVYSIAKEQGGGIPEDSIIIAGLLHDICKARKLYYDDNGLLHHRHTHIHGHGYRSIKILERCGLVLTEEERLAIRWHMGGHHAKGEETKEVIRARNMKLWQVVHYADHIDAAKKNIETESQACALGGKRDQLHPKAQQPRCADC